MKNSLEFPDILSRQQAAEYLHVCRTTLDRLNLPRIKVRRRVLFTKAAVDKWLAENTTRKGGCQ
ncbi:helix-turn-helix domain-containing protein [Treponema sp. TIM-1]|uniref:helix-turn-helix domain-containing protein n=1 Tax=Treponema sp. TIM-1 TaxID=2898417 RepID=UPI00398040B0